MAKRVVTKRAVWALAMARAVAGVGAGDEGRAGLKIDCEQGFVAVAPSPTTKSKITGVLPEGVLDDSSWAEVEVEYGVLTSNVAEGRQALRVQVKKVSKGVVQLVVPKVGLMKEKDLRVSLSVKSPDAVPMRLGVRQRGAPYQYYWERAVATGPEWSKLEFVVPSGGKEADADSTVLMLIFDQAGTVDIDDIRTEYVAPAQAAAGEVLEHRVNLLPTGSFLDGVSAPWAFTNRPDAWTDEKEISPTARAALHVRFHRNPGEPPFVTNLRAPFYASPGKSYTFSLYAKAGKAGQALSLRFGPAGEKLWTEPFAKNVSVGTQWKRYSHTVTLGAVPEGYYIVSAALDGTGEAWLDGLQVREGDGPGAAEYVPAKAEVALQAMKEDGLGVASEGEPIRVMVSATPVKEAGARVAVSAMDLNGNRAEVTPLPLPASGLSRQVIELPQGGLAPFGTYRVKASVVDASGKAMSVPGEVMVHRVRAARYADTFAPESAFGIHDGTGHLLDERLGAVKKLGFNHLRLFTTFAWHNIEAKKGTYDFAAADRDVELLQKHKMGALGILAFGAPAWAANNPTGYKGWARFMPSDMKAWGVFCGEVVGRYKGKVETFESWNEPYLPHFFTREVTPEGKRLGGSTEQILQMHRACYEAAKAANPDAQIGWNINALDHPEIASAAIAGGVLERLQLITLHQYNPSSAIEGELSRHAVAMRGLLPEGSRGGKKNVPLWLSEGGAGPSQVFNFYETSGPRKTLEDARYWGNWTSRYYLGCLLAGMDRVYLYMLSDEPSYKNDYMVQNIDGRLGPNLMAVSNLAWHVDGTKYLRTVAVGESPATRVHLFTGSGRTCAVFTAVQRTLHAERLPKDSVVTDTFGNPLGAEGMRLGELVFVTSSVTAEAMESAIRPALAREGK
jgi:hypothetical protein